VFDLACPISRFYAVIISDLKKESIFAQQYGCRCNMDNKKDLEEKMSILPKNFCNTTYAYCMSQYALR
jgi:hypothetical protein